MRRNLIVLANNYRATVCASNKKREFVIHYTYKDNPEDKVEVISAYSPEDAEEEFNKKFKQYEGEYTIQWIAENSQSDPLDYEEIFGPANTQPKYIYSDSLDEMVVSGFYIDDDEEGVKHYSWNDEDCLYYWDEADDDWYDEVPDNAYFSTRDVQASTGNGWMVNHPGYDPIGLDLRELTLSGPEPLTKEGFYSFFSKRADTSYFSRAAQILYDWYISEGEEYMPDDYLDIIDMCKTHGTDEEKDIVLKAMGESSSVLGSDTFMEPFTFQYKEDTVDRQDVTDLVYDGWDADELENYFQLDGIENVDYLYSSKDPECPVAGAKYFDGRYQTIYMHDSNEYCTYEQMINNIFNASSFNTLEEEEN